MKKKIIYIDMDGKLGRLRTLIHNIDYLHNYVDLNQYIEHINKQIAYLETHINEDKKCPKTVKERYFALKEIRKLIMDTNIRVSKEKTITQSLENFLYYVS